MFAINESNRQSDLRDEYLVINNIFGIAPLVYRELNIPQIFCDTFPIHQYFFASYLVN
jgi:hypothetical protein